MYGNVLVAESKSGVVSNLLSVFSDQNAETDAI